MRAILLLSTAVGSVLLAACGAPSDGASPANPSSGTPAGSSSGPVLRVGEPYTVSDYRFTPLIVSSGQKVEVVDEDDEPHTLTAIDGAFDTGSFDGTKPGTLTAPTEPGTYEFICEIHPSMTGTLTVQQ